MIETKIDENNTLYTFYGLGDYVDVSESNKYANSRSESRKNSAGVNNFAGGTYEDAVEQAKSGNPELVESFYDGVEALNAMIEASGRAFTRDVTGEFFDVGDFLAGEPECWWKDDSLEGKRQVVPVYVNTCMSCWVSNTIIKNRGCAIVALCDMLQKQGFIVDLNIVCVSRYPGGKKLYEKCLVPTDPIDLDAMAFMVANPLFLRRLEFSICEVYLKCAHPDSYGAPTEYDLPDIFDSGVSGFYFSSSAHSTFSDSNYCSLEDAKKHVLDMIDEFAKDEKQVIFG